MEELTSKFAGVGIDLNDKDRIVSMSCRDFFSLDISKDDCVRVQCLKNKYSTEIENCAYRPFVSSLTEQGCAELIYDFLKYREEALAHAEKIGRHTFFNSLIVLTIDLIVDLYENAAFYSGVTRVDLTNSPAKKMCDDKGVIRCWEKVLKFPEKLVEEAEGSKLSVKILSLLTDFLNEFLCDAIGRARAKDIFRLSGFEECLENFERDKSDEKARDHFIHHIESILRLLRQRHIELELKEEEQYDANPDWECVVYDEPDEYDFRETRKSFSDAIHDFHKKYPDAIGLYYEITDGIKDNEYLRADSPLAFPSLYGYFQDKLEEALTIPPFVRYKDIIAERTWGKEWFGLQYPNIWIHEARLELLKALLSYLNERSNACEKYPTARRRWLEAIADLLVCDNHSPSWFVLNNEQAAKLINDANAAAREEWIEKQMGEPTKENTLANAANRFADAAERLAGVSEDKRVSLLEMVNEFREIRGKDIPAMGEQLRETVKTAVAPIVSQFDPKDRYLGIDKISNMMKQTQVRAAIDVSWDENYAVIHPKKGANAQTTNGKNTLASLAEYVWSKNSSWDSPAFDGNGYRRGKNYEVALREQAERNPRSFRWAD